MTDQSPSPSAAALDLIEEFVDEIAALPSWDKERRHKSIAAFGCAINAFAAQAVAAERAKPAASDLERAAQAYGFVTMPDPVSLFPAQMEMIERIAAALAERGRVERERAEGALAIVGELQKLVVNVCGWVGSGCSETAVKAMRDAMNHGWRKVGWADFCERESAIRNQTLTGD